jgi:protein-disulfide isomerase
MAVAALAIIAFTTHAWLRNSRTLPPQPVAGVAAAGPPALKIPNQPQPIPEAPVIGSRNAKVVIIEYSDFQCPFCALYARETWPQVKAEYVDNGKVQLVFKHLPLPSHQFARSAAIGAECAAQQGRFSEMHDILFRAESLSEDSAQKAALTLPLNRAAFADCLNKRGPERVALDLQSAKELGVVATPSFLLGIVSQAGHVQIKQVFVGVPKYDRFKTVVEELIAQAEKAGPLEATVGR